MKDTMSPTLKQKSEKIKELARKKHILLRTQKLMEKRNPALARTSPQEKPPMNLLEEYREMEKQGLMNLVDLIDEYVPRSKFRKGEPSDQASSDLDKKP